MKTYHLLLTIILTAACLTLSLTATAAKVYKVIDKQGNVTYTDQPPLDDKEATTAKLPFINTHPAPTMNTAPDTATETDEIEKLFSGYTRLLIKNPKDQQTFTTGQRTVNVNVELTPDLQPGHRVQIIFDGSPQGQPTAATSFVLEDLNRGEHQIFFRVVDETGKHLASSAEVTIYVHRAHNSLVETEQSDTQQIVQARSVPGLIHDNPFTFISMQKRAEQRSNQ